jgi:hypothetical protein
MRDQTEVTERRRITWGQYDQAAAETNLRRLRRRSCLTLLGVSLAFCCFLSLLTNVAQSCRGAAALRPYNCRYVLGYRSCVQISVHPLNVGSELYIQEMGGAQKMPEG